MNANEFGQLDAQNPCTSFAQMTPEEHEEYQDYLDQQMEPSCPVCGLCTCDGSCDLGPEDDIDPEPDESMDGDFDSAMASAGLGTDEDYGYYGGSEEW